MFCLGLCHSVLYTPKGAHDLERLLGIVYQREADASLDARTVCTANFLQHPHC
jgi:hypothetical protein